MSNKFTFTPATSPIGKPGSVLTRLFRQALLDSGTITHTQLAEKVKKYVDQQEGSYSERELAIKNIVRGLSDENMSFSMFMKGMRILDQAFTIQLGNGNN